MRVMLRGVELADVSLPDSSCEKARDERLRGGSIGATKVVSLRQLHS